jgi:hypothetical protein
MEFEHILVDEAAPFVRRITLNRPERRRPPSAGQGHEKRT